MIHTNRLTVGILAHVDAGKTTLSEAILYQSGRLRRLGRVDHRDAFLDTDAQERERGITIFSKQAEFEWKKRPVTLMDTPGHVDFSGETERVLGVLDCAILVISGADGVQGHTLTLWKLLKKYNLPVFLFVNKMDQPGTDKKALLASLRERFGAECADTASESFLEDAAGNDENAISEFLETGTLSLKTISGLVEARKLFPCRFGSALKLDGVDALLDSVCAFMGEKEYPDEFSARVYKIARDAQGARLTYLKVTGGTLRVRALLSGGGSESPWEEKISQIRFYSGVKFNPADEAPAGAICAVTGLTQTKCGEGLGAEAASPAPALEPVFHYQVILPPDADPHNALSRLKTLEEEDPLLRVAWNARLKEIRVQLMGEVQLEILKRALLDRFGLNVDFGEGGILYKETISTSVEGVGHYEPLRHYAEVHLLMEPAPRGKGIRISSACSEDDLERNWQRLIFTHLLEKQHVGVLTGSPITDIDITLLAGRAHLKHTEGGDFREATYRAVRQGLMCAKSVLLEPWYDIQLVIPSECVGRAINDITQMGGKFDPPETAGEETVIIGAVPVRDARSYAREVAIYTRGRGRLTCSVRGYDVCRDPEKVISEIGYDWERDTANSPDSVFCSHGAGVLVKWNEAPSRMHIQTGAFAPVKNDIPELPRPVRQDADEQEKQLMAIFERTYGQIKPRSFDPRAAAPAVKTFESVEPPRPEYLLVDGYNIINAWDDLRETAQTDLEGARRALMDILSNYQGFQSARVILVFDAYRVPMNPGSVEKYDKIDVVYTKEAETADSYIEKATYEISKRNRVRVATSDGMEQLIILGNGALRVPATEFRKEIESAKVEINKILAENNRRKNGRAVERALADAQRRKLEKP